MEEVQEAREETRNVATSSSSKDLSKSLPEEAFNNFLQGKRHMLVQDYQFAVQSLATACELYVKHFGELAIECGEVYFLYGKALFRLSQQQAGILGGALNEGSNEEDENSSESGSQENENDESEKNSDTEGGDENEAEADKEEKEPSESTDSPQAVVDESSSEAKAKEEIPKSSKEIEENVENIKTAEQVSSSDDTKTEKTVDASQEPEEDDLELAWNTLETAKSIFKKQDTIESQLKVAEILQLLAEISMESDNNAAAINDLKESLEIQKKHLKPDDRILAETYYQMGLAQTLDKQYKDALENYRTTKQILQLRVENLKNTPVDESAGSFASADKEAELSDLGNILLDIQEKIEDTEELFRNNKKESEETFAVTATLGPTKEKSQSSTSSKPVSNITHLLKRKKPEEVSSEGDSKRIKISTNVVNGETKHVPPETGAKSEG